MTFSTKLGMSVSAVFLASFIIIAYFGYRSTTGILENEIRDYLEDHASDAVDKLDRMLHERYADIRILSSDPVLSSRSSTPEQITERLIQYKNEYKIYSSLSFFDMNRIRIADTSGKDIGWQHAITEYWKDIAAGRDLVMKITESATTKQAIIHFVAVVKDRQGKRLGVVASRMPVESIYEIVGQNFHTRGDLKHTKVELLDKDGLILYSSYNQKGILKEKSRDWEFLRSVMSSGKRSGSVRHSYEGEDEITAFAVEQGQKDFFGNGWTMVICTPVSIAFAPAHAQRNIFAYLFSGFIGIVLVASFLVSRAAVRPLKKLVGAVTEIGKGNFNIHVDVTSEDEIGDLAQAFNDMAIDLKNSEKKYRDLAELLPQFVFETDDKGDIRFFNRFALEHLGYSQEDFNNGLHAFQMFIPEDRDRIRENIQRVLSGEFVDGLEFTAVRKDGTVFPVLISASPIILKDKITGIRGIAIDITERKKAEEIMQMRRSVTERLNKALIELAKSEKIYGGDLGAAFSVITETSARAMDVGRSSIWFYAEGRSGIRCADLYDLNSGNHSEGVTLDASDFPGYFKAMREEDLIAADDAVTDPRTTEFSESYLKPFGIASKLDVPIHLEGQVIGVVCHEHVGAIRTWTVEEQSFGTAIAGFTAVAIEIFERKKVEESLRKSEERIKKINDELALKVDEVERINKLMVGRELKMAAMRAEMEGLRSKFEKMETKG